MCYEIPPPYDPPSLSPEARAVLESIRERDGIYPSNVPSIVPASHKDRRVLLRALSVACLYMRASGWEHVGAALVEEVSASPAEKILDTDGRPE